MEIKINEFEGPLELLHLQLKKNKTDIYNVDISIIADQFLEYIYELDKLNMNETSSFILLAADLISIKTKLLLQTPTEEEGNPVEELAFRLEVYETFVNISEKLREMQNHDVFYRKKVEIVETTAIELNMVPDTLYKVFLNLLKPKPEIEAPPIPTIPVEQETFTIEEKMTYWQNILEKNKNINFKDEIKKANNVSEKVVIFLALLELIAAKKVFIEQNGEEIVVFKQYG